MAKAPPPPSSSTSSTFPRRWVVAQTVVLLVPWLVAAVWMSTRDAARERPTPVAAGAGSSQWQAADGAWGRLTLTPIVIAPPLEYLPTTWGRNAPPEWVFAQVTLDQVLEYLRNAGATADQVAQLRQVARTDGRNVVMRPPADLVRALPSTTRTRLYLELGRSDANYDQAFAFRFLGETADAWFDGSLLSPQTRSLIEPLLYRDGPFLHFADLEAIRAEIGGPGELRLLGKTLLRNATMLVQLSVPSAEDVEGLEDYWGIGGRRTDIRPLLESLAADPGHQIDIVHLLPAFARDHLYRFPKLTSRDLNRPLLANCLWSSLNFFSRTPDDAYLEVEAAFDALRSDYYVVSDDFQLGDIVVLIDERGEMFHAAVYLADGLLFTKNGTSALAPWTIMSLDDLLAYYQHRSSSPKAVFHRFRLF